jgi:hypothetical protein
MSRWVDRCMNEKLDKGCLIPVTMIAGIPALWQSQDFTEVLKKFIAS